ncbi:MULTISPECIES: EscU/YscU/HrcU family type III secretion system export apparatus switch protein [Myxococcaceae]|uniref:FlhB/HrpN/YscU/SpaS family protein n=5 Tax=Myxococcaceae TaxID=31 RepID=Q1D9K2_MYXXD|nr:MULTISPECIES: EscU/YscU/HrcU family type III secretion system export apparatus switch protein [Myxococcaceae]NVJ10520.1 EscU/YscU/HrcU family type III secretion system export apparatus switch protein [Myxococcus sp. AM001]ABF91921.1 FlhB/HrpN/YscU/SpaS family protein [Myxococcus xanthus DK 1622]AEI65891.1 FlhB/HrpN/YscU/SpaS family protein [Corallococcus macrosporus]ATB46808.1 type III secretion protein [Corallococcus macrosporus DSM 14697]NOJ53830.1 flagellar biosynthesis protein FlhB [Myx
MSDDAEIAIALKYDKEKDGAPRVVAKGMRLKAEKIREIAREHNIPLMRNVNLANALYRVEVGQEVPEELYDAVAEVLNFVYELQREQAAAAARR